MDINSLYDWIISNWSSKCNVQESASVPTDAPSSGKITFHYNTDTKKVYSYDFANSKWVEGVGGGGGSSNYVAVTDSTDLTLAEGSCYDLQSAFGGKVLKLNKPSALGVTIRIMNSTSVANTSYFTTIVPNTNVQINNLANNFVYDTPCVVDLVGVATSADPSTAGSWMLVPVWTGDRTDVVDVEVMRDDFSVSNGKTYLVDTTLKAITVTVPSNVSTYPYSFKVLDMKGTASTNNITVDFTTNGYKFEGVASTNFIINTNNRLSQFVSSDATYGFKEFGSTDFNISALVTNTPKYTDVGWTTYTPTIGVLSGTAPTLHATAMVNALYCIVGKTLKVKMNICQSTAGISGAGTYTYSLPSGVVINTAIHPLDTTGLATAQGTNIRTYMLPLGYGTGYMAGSAGGMLKVYPSGTNKVSLMASEYLTGTSSIQRWQGNLYFSYSAQNLQYEFCFEVAIL